ncbi:hypothetical protein BUALT_Bualt05G0149600 [Buddleja alternifolia]|uniref:Transcription factor Iwr1 domain-containing protein n=1 Tax=Buddleja alternifolia TaxID=168488 RepID=A0AAV6XVS7_9LAMI|nr:hypothetical protein BUALT_Bualt05G0149600 [Buddleja alternifolia]
MAETQPKRLREESHVENIEFDDSKRQKQYNNIFSLLDEEEEERETTQDFSSIFTTLEQELSSSTTSPPCTAEEEAAHHQQIPTAGHSEDVTSVIRHLLEASDDELGIPNVEDNDNKLEINSAENFSNFDFSDNYYDNCLWEIEDVDASYYNVMQSELYM